MGAPQADEDREVLTESANPMGWNGWYRFARDELGFRHEECVEYANLRFVEEENRAALHAANPPAAASADARPGQGD